MRPTLAVVPPMSNDITFCVAVRRGDGAGGDDAGRGAGLHHVHGPRLGRGRCHHAAVGLHHVERRGGAERVQAGLERVHVARDDRHDGGVHRGGAGAQVLAVLRAHARMRPDSHVRAAPDARPRPPHARGRGSDTNAAGRRRRPRRLLAVAAARPDARHRARAPAARGPRASSRSVTSRLQRRGTSGAGFCRCTS